MIIQPIKKFRRPGLGYIDVLLYRWFHLNFYSAGISLTELDQAASSGYHLAIYLEKVGAGELFDQFFQTNVIDIFLAIGTD